VVASMLQVQFYQHTRYCDTTLYFTCQDEVKCEIKVTTVLVENIKGQLQYIILKSLHC
jgi:hypothetical protein